MNVSVCVSALAYLRNQTTTELHRISPACCPRPCMEGLSAQRRCDALCTSGSRQVYSYTPLERNSRNCCIIITVKFRSTIKISKYTYRELRTGGVVCCCLRFQSVTHYHCVSNQSKQSQRPRAAHSYTAALGRLSLFTSVEW